MPGNVMVVEDDPQLCDMLTRFIAESGFPVRSARSAREAIAQFDDVDPRVVILDLKLPDGDGLDLLRLFKRRLPGCKIVIMSSYSDVDTVVEAMRLGAENIRLDKHPNAQCVYGNSESHLPYSLVITGIAFGIGYLLLDLENLVQLILPLGRILTYLGILNGHSCL